MNFGLKVLFAVIGGVWSYKDRKELLVTYKPMLPCKDKLVSFIGRYPRLFFMVSTIVKPLLPGLRYVYLKIKDRKSSLL